MAPVGCLPVAQIRGQRFERGGGGIGVALGVASGVVEHDQLLSRPRHAHIEQAQSLGGDVDARLAGSLARRILVERAVAHVQ